MFGLRLSTLTFSRQKRSARRLAKKDIIVEQVKKVLGDTDQKLILMARG